MKFSSVVILLFTFSIFSYAQKTLKAASVAYELTEIESDAPEVQMMKGSSMNLYFNKKKQKIEMSFMGGLMEVVNITDLKTEKNTMLTNIMGQKTLVRMSKEEAEAQKAKNTKQNFEVTYDKNDKKEIVGYNCYKAVLKSKDGSTVNAYVTDEIKTKVNFFKDMFPGLNVFPLEYSIENAGIAMVFSAQKFETSVDSDVFKIPTEGYTEMTFAEFEKQMGNLGGLGF